VTGSISTEYVYCGSATVGSADTYTFGRRFCSKIVSEFEGDAKLWWEDYIQGGGKRHGQGVGQLGSSFITRYARRWCKHACR
jgi:hypothetical protein